MSNEGRIVNDTTAVVKSEIVNQLRRLGPTTPEELERAVFKALTGHEREEVDWEIEDNQAGYFSWLKSFDKLITELVEDGYMLVEGKDDERRLVPIEQEPHSDYCASDKPDQA